MIVSDLAEQRAHTLTDTVRSANANLQNRTDQVDVEFIKNSVVVCLPFGSLLVSELSASRLTVSAFRLDFSHCRRVLCNLHFDTES